MSPTEPRDCCHSNGVPFCVLCMRITGTSAQLPTRWLLLECVHRGHAAWIYKGQDQATGAPIAAKFSRTEDSMPGSVLDDPRDREALLALRHENLVRVLAIERISAWDIWILEWREAIPLADLVAQGGCLPQHGAAAILLQVANGLSVLHARQWLHGDIKPQNILVDTQGHTSITDFDLMRNAAFRSPAANLSRQTAGTDYFMAPELRQGLATCDGRADLFALGVMGWWLTHGDLPPWAEPHSKDSAMHTPGNRTRQSTLDLDDLSRVLCAEAPQDRLSLTRTREILGKLSNPWSVDELDALPATDNVFVSGLDSTPELANSRSFLKGGARFRTKTIGWTAILGGTAMLAWLAWRVWSGAKPW